MLAHCRFVNPQEACGLLAGVGGCATVLYVIENRMHSSVAYEMDGRQQVLAMLDAENRGLQMLAVYHSHPNGPAGPSPRDISEAHYPELVQIIVSLADAARPIARAFLIAGGETASLDLRVEQPE
jgi:proteasome lid subunit RPN8/RPN11